MITIGLPTVNSELRITTQLDSLLAQTYEDFKILISDNASTDGTYDICQEYCKKDSRVVVIRQPERLNMRDNFKFLLDKAETAYFTWQQDDDILDQKWLEVTHGELEARPEMNMAFTDSTLEKDGVDKTSQKNYDINKDPLLRLRQLFLDRSYLLWMFVGIDGLWRTEHLQQCFGRLIQVYEHENLLGTDNLLMFISEINRDYSFIRQNLFTKRLLSDQRTYRTNYTYRDRYVQSRRMMSQSIVYMTEVINASDYSEEDKRKLIKLARSIARNTITNASWLRRLKWRMLPWYRKTSKSKAADQDG